MKKIVNIFVKALISCGFFYVLFTFVETNELAVLVSQVDWFYLVLSFGITWIMIIASCMKWKVLLDLKGKKQSFSSLMKVYCIGYFFSNLLPSTIGGDVVRSYYVGERINNHAHSAVAIFIERFSGILFLFVLAIVMPLFHFQLYTIPYVYIPALASLFFLFLFTWLGKAKAPMKFLGALRVWLFNFFGKLVQHNLFRWAEKPFQWLEKTWISIEGKLQKLRDELGDAVQTIKNDRTCLIKIIVLTAVFYILTWFNIYFGYKTFNVEPSFLLICALTPTIMFAAHLPVTMLGNIGYFESIFVFYFLLVGIPAEQSLAMGLLLRVKVLSVGIIGFFIYTLYKKNKKSGDEFAAALKKGGAE